MSKLILTNASDKTFEFENVQEDLLNEIDRAMDRAKVSGRWPSGVLQIRQACGVNHAFNLLSLAHVVTVHGQGNTDPFQLIGDDEPQRRNAWFREEP
jgi:hypothetical protein